MKNERAKIAQFGERPLQNNKKLFKKLAQKQASEMEFVISLAKSFLENPKVGRSFRRYPQFAYCLLEK